MNQDKFDKMAKNKKDLFEKKCKDVENAIAELEEMRKEMLDTLRLAAEAKWDEDEYEEDEEDVEDDGFRFVLNPYKECDLSDERYVMLHYDPSADTLDDGNITMAVEKNSDWHMDAAAMAYALAYLIAAYGEKDLEGLNIAFAAKKAVSAIGDSYLADAFIGAMKKVGKNMEDDDDE